jgi:hypothetical protein
MWSVLALICLTGLACQTPRPDRSLAALCEPTDPTLPNRYIIDNAPSFLMENPASGALLRVSVLAPEEPEGWTVVLVPPGVSEARTLHDDVRRLLLAGAVAVVFDPDGRGESEGEEDFGGAVHQTGLAQVIRVAAELPCTERVGVLSLSLGDVMATGALAGAPDLPAAFLADWEGPSDRESAGCNGNSLGLPACDDEAFWAEREPVVSVTGLALPYHRLQTLRDHVHLDNAHARQMLTAALSGGVPGVYLNGAPITEPPESLTPWMQDWRDPRRHPEVLLRWADEAVP